jgi:antitoxin component YwqK of YwqJK toxin-antitoxin module
VKYILTLLLSFSLLQVFAQDPKKEERILYIIDNVPVIKDPDKSSGSLKNEDVDHLEVVTNPDKIKALGYDSVDKIIYITTKEFVKRSDNLKQIPTTKTMDRKDGQWYLKDATTPYSGRFIDYFLNGKKQGEGSLKNGLVNGIRTVYFENGNKSAVKKYSDGINNGPSEEYFVNGALKQKGSFKDGKDDGLWIEYYSTGVIKRQTNFLNLVPDMTKDEKRFYDLKSKAQALLQIKKLDDAEKLNSKYADIYFYRGTAKLDNFDFDSAILDFDKAIELEPLYMEALANRAFTRIRKYEFKGARKLSKNSEITILASKDKADIPVDDKEKICKDLNKSVELGDDKEMILAAIKQYCYK